MPDEALKRRFEQALSAEAYAAAWRFSCRLAAGRQDAEDLLQDALAQAYVGFAQLREPGRFVSWLLSIVRRSYLMHRRSALRRPRTVASYADITPHAPADSFQEAVLAAVRNLPEAQRALLTLVYMEGLSHAEVAQALRVKPGAVRMRLLRARRALRAEAERWLAGNPVSEKTQGTAIRHPKRR